MTFKTFRELTSGVSHYQLYFQGKWIVGKEVFEYDNYLITEFDFVADDSGTITCTLDIEEVDQKQSIFFFTLKWVLLPDVDPMLSNSH